MIRVVNFPFCNFFSLARYFRVRNLHYEVVEDLEGLSIADTIILPGVGTFKQGMEYLAKKNLVKEIQAHAARKGKLLGICLGMQMLLESSDESPGVEGLGLIPGSCKRIPQSLSFPVPHIGWNEIYIHSDKSNPFSSLSGTAGLSESDFYFVHSYYANPLDPGTVIASFEHPSGLLAAAIAHESCTGFQFHPEKSGFAGYNLLDRFFLP